MRIELIASLLLVASTARAQTGCDGKKISAVVIQRSERTVMDKARAPRWSQVVLQPLLLGTPTHENAIRPFLQLHVGETCSEQRRAESERLLRLQPYLADATVRTIDEADGSVRVEVETVDDIRLIIGFGLRGSTPSNATLGNGNVSGSGQLGAVNWRNGRAYRNGFGARYADYHVLDRTIRANLDLEQQPLGTLVQASLARPFFTDFERSAGFAGYLRDDGYVGFVRPEGDPVSLNTVRQRADVGAAFRLGIGGSARVLLGALAGFERRRTASQPVLITDSGFVASSDSTLVGRYATADATQLGVVTGVRAISFVKAKGFDALEGVQDVARGAQFVTTFGTSFATGRKEPFVSGDLYVGVGGAESFAAMRTQFETRERDGRAGNTVASGRLAWYARPSDRVTQIWSLQYEGAWREDIPFQLTVNDPVGGIPGYTASRLAGGRLLVARTERRFSMPGISSYLGWGIAGFADAAQMWKGDAPYGATGARASAGVSILAAVPRQSRSLARVDIAYPLASDRNAKKTVVRFSYAITGRSFWRESGQISRARLGTSASDIFSWP